MLTHAAYHFISDCIGFLISDRCHVRFATLVDNKRDVRDDIEYT